VRLLCVMRRNCECSMNSLTTSMKRSTFASSSGASTSSRRQKGLGLALKTAKRSEIVVSTFAVLYGLGGEVGEHDASLQEAIRGAMTPLTAYGFMVFTLIYMPCLATVAVIKQETGSWKWTAFAAGYSLALAWIMAFIVVRGGRLLGLG